MWLFFYWHKHLRAKETIVHSRDTNKYFWSEKTVTCPRWGSTKNIKFFQKMIWEKFLVSDKLDFFPLYFLISLWFFPSLFKQTGIRKPSLAICLPTLTTSFFFSNLHLQETALSEDYSCWDDQQWAYWDPIGC